MGGREAPGAAAGRLFRPTGMRSRIGAEEELRRTARGGRDHPLAVLLTLQDREAVVVRAVWR